MESGILFSQWHQWVIFDGDKATVGVTDRVIDHLDQQVLAIDLARPGEIIRKGEGYGVIESTRRAWDLVAPLQGVILEINREAIAKPGLVSQAPYGDGWLVRFKVLDEQDIDSLISSKEYETLPGISPIK